VKGLAVGFLFFAQIAFAQVAPSSGQMESSRNDSWALFGGFAYTRQSANYVGWTGSVAEYPYPSHPWVGGVIEGSGGYRNESGVNLGSYTAMAGPSFKIRPGRIQPFARFMVGAVVNTASVPASVSVTTRNFGIDAGGGLDFTLSEHWAVRAQADWINYGKSGSHANMGKAASGVVLRF
jgi:opacity protein-like surface antigen